MLTYILLNFEDLFLKIKRFFLFLLSIFIIYYIFININCFYLFYLCVYFYFTLTFHAFLTFLTFIIFYNHLSLQFKNGDEMLQVLPFGKPPLIRNIFRDHF